MWVFFFFTCVFWVISRSNTAFMLDPHQTKHLQGGFICRLHLFTATRLEAAERSLVQETCYKCQIVPPLHYLGWGGRHTSRGEQQMVVQTVTANSSSSDQIHLSSHWLVGVFAACNIPHMHLHCFIVYYRGRCLQEISDSVGVHGG